MKPSHYSTLSVLFGYRVSAGNLWLDQINVHTRCKSPGAVPTLSDSSLSLFLSHKLSSNWHYRLVSVLCEGTQGSVVFCSVWSCFFPVAFKVVGAFKNLNNLPFFLIMYWIIYMNACLSRSCQTKHTFGLYYNSSVLGYNIDKSAFKYSLFKFTVNFVPCSFDFHFCYFVHPIMQDSITVVPPLC